MEALQKDWLNQEELKTQNNKKHKNHKKKGQYLHFDKRMPRLSIELVKDVWNPAKVVRHYFYPYIRFVKKIKRYVKDPSTKKKSFKIKERPIDTTAHHDAVIYSWYSYLIQLRYEKELTSRSIHEVAIAYRSSLGKSSVEFAKDIIYFIKTHPEYSVLNFDVEKFFENLDHLKIKTQWSKLFSLSRLEDDHFHVFLSITNYHYVDIEKLHKIFGFTHKDHPRKQQICTASEFRSKIAGAGLLIKNSRYREDNGKRYSVGIPQGTSLSCVISNLYMIDFDEAISSYVNSIGGFYRRYSDDIILIIPQDQVAVVEALIDIEADKVYLKLNKNKTEKHHFIGQNGKLVCIDSNKQKISPLQYLGIQFDGEEGFLRHAGIAKFQRRRNRAVRNTIGRLTKGRHIPKKMYLQKFTHEGKENYLGYANKAQDILKSRKIKLQVSKNRVSRQLKDRINKSLNRKR